MVVDSMSYQEGMEVLSSDIIDKVLTYHQQYDANKYTEQNVLHALGKSHLDIEDFAALLSHAALPYLEIMARKAKHETQKHYGNSISIFTPLYIANYCQNHCVYCGFHCKNKIKRGILSFEEIESELEAIAKTGLKDILLLTGESRKHSSINYIGEAVKIATKYFSTIGIEIYPLNTEEYSFLRDCGVDFVSVYQETYDPIRYEEVHKSGPKRSYPYRFHSQERALLGGMRGVAFGALLGLGDFRRDAFATGVHAAMIQQKYPHAEISFSTPRLRPYLHKEKQTSNDVYEKELLQVILAYRLLMPYAGITISTRERALFRDHVIGMAATRISAGVRVGVGGHKDEEKGDGQFEISDSRSVKEVHDMILGKGLQPVYTDYIRV